MGNKEVMLLLYADGLTLYVENTQGLTEKY